MDDFYNVGDAGVTNDTPPYTTAPPDGSGGAGSFLPGLLNTLTNGLNTLANAKISEEIGKTLGQSGLAYVDDNGNVVYRGAPATPAPVQVSPSYAAKSFFSSQAGILTIAGVAAVILFLAVRK